MANQYDKVTLHLENDIPMNNEILSKNLSVTVVELLAPELLNDAEFIDRLINVIKEKI